MFEGPALHRLRLIFTALFVAWVGFIAVATQFEDSISRGERLIYPAVLFVALAIFLIGERAVMHSSRGSRARVWSETELLFGAVVIGSLTWWGLVGPVLTLMAIAWVVGVNRQARHAGNPPGVTPGVA